MIRAKLEKYLIWSGFEYTGSYNINDDIFTYSLNNFKVEIGDRHISVVDKDNNTLVIYKYYPDNFKEIFEAITSIKLITEEPKSTIEEQIKDVKLGDFIKLKYEYLYRPTNTIETETDVFIVSYVDEKYINMLIPINHIAIKDVAEIIYIQANNFEGVKHE